MTKKQPLWEWQRQLQNISTLLVRKYVLLLNAELTKEEFTDFVARNLK